MGKEKQVIGELYDVLDSLAEELWPRAPGVARNDDTQSDEDEDEDEEDFEKALANELSAIKKPGANERRLTTCIANPNEISSLARRILKPVFEDEPRSRYRYKIQTRIRNNTKLSSEVLVEEIAKCVLPELGHTVDLQNPEMVVLVEVYQACHAPHPLLLNAVCGISVVPDWLKYKRFNVVEYAQSLNRADQPKESEQLPGQ
ncbi:hypothetical protein FRC05_007784 [Tulasnella sp. 425]|nr:hypothetical protein FRC05_007784 [Tulasnella sp. 425]